MEKKELHSKKLIYEGIKRAFWVSDGIRLKLQELGFELLSFETVLASEELQRNVTAIVTCPGATRKVNQVLPLLPNLKTISFMTAGFEGLDIKQCLQRHVTVGNTSVAMKEIVADFSIALMLASAKALLPGIEAAKVGQRGLSNIPTAIHLTGGTLGIVGMGQIGFEAAKRAHMGFRMKILYHNRSRRCVEDEACIQATYFDSLHDMLPRCDVVLLTCPLNNQTHHMFAEKEFELMKKTSIIVNVGRGPVVNHEDLVKALESGDVARAALDVTEPEPLPREHPLLHMPNVVVTPHQSSHSAELYKAAVDVTLENLLRGLEEKTLACEVNLQNLLSKA